MRASPSHERTAGGAAHARTPAAGRTVWRRYQSPLGAMRIVGDGRAITHATFDGQKYDPTASDDWREDPRDPCLAEAARQLDRYFAGRLAAFDLPLAPRGTGFQQAVWRAIAGVPAGSTISYGELARRAGRPSAVRAAAAATGRNPLSIVVPCHRIVGADGSLTGYAGGLDRKRALLAIEHAAAARAR